jgi:MFS family permease
MEKNLLPGNSNQYRKAYVIFMAINASLGFFWFGYNLGVFNPMQDFVQNNVYTNLKGSIVLYLITAFLTIGAAMGGPMGSVLSSRLGMKNSLILIDFISACGIVLEILPSEYCMLFGRLVCGIGVGLNNAMSPLYISEIAPPSARGSLMSSTQNMIGFGILVSFSLGLGLPDGKDDPDSQWWRFMFIFPAIFLAIRTLCLMFIFTNDAPKSLITRGKVQEARESLKAIYGNAYTDEKLDLIQREVAEAKSSGQETYAVLFSRAFRPRFLLALTMACTTVTGGVTAIAFYSNKIFAQSTNGNQSLDTTYSLIYSVCGILGSLSSAKGFGWFSRRQMLCGGLFMLGLLTAAFGVVNQIDGDSNPALKYFLFVFGFAYNFGFGPTFYCYLVEILPGFAFGLIVVFIWAVSFVIGVVFPLILTHFGGGVAFLICAFCNIVQCFICYIWCQETKGKNALEINQAFAKKSHQQILQDSDMSS